jgi:hypothetical protein
MDLASRARRVQVLSFLQTGQAPFSRGLKRTSMLSRVAEKARGINLKPSRPLGYSHAVGIVDRSLVRPVLDALGALCSSRQDLAVYYSIIDRFCARWFGRSPAEMDLDSDEAIYLAHDLLREYLRFEGNDRRVALWLLTINRCCQNAVADLSGVRREFDRSVQEADLDFDHTLLAPILVRARGFEERHESAAEDALGARDTLGSFFQWIGVYCTYVYPRLVQDAHASDRSMVSTLAFLISEFISLKENVSRMAALLLAIKHACSWCGRPAGGEPHAGVVDTAVKPGTEAEYVQRILERLGAESAERAEGARSRPKSAAGEPDPSSPPLVPEIIALALALESAPRGGVRGEIDRLRGWGRARARDEAEALTTAVSELMEREGTRSRQSALRMARQLGADGEKAMEGICARLEGASGAGRALLSRLTVLALLSAFCRQSPTAKAAAGQGLLAVMRSVRESP